MGDGGFKPQHLSKWPSNQAVTGTDQPPAETLW